MRYLSEVAARGHRSDKVQSAGPVWARNFVTRTRQADQQRRCQGTGIAKVCCKWARTVQEAVTPVARQAQTGDFFSERCACKVIATCQHHNMVETALQLDRSKSNPLFDNWKLAKGLSVSENVITLDRPVTLRDHSTDYLNTRAAVLHNHIHQQGQRWHVFAASAGGTTIQEVVISENADLRTLCGKLVFSILAVVCDCQHQTVCARPQK